MQRLLGIKEFAKKIGVSQQTLRYWDREGILKPQMTTPGGHRKYTKEQAEEYFNNGFQTQKKRVFFYFLNGEVTNTEVISTLTDKEKENLITALKGGN